MACAIVFCFMVCIVAAQPVVDRGCSSVGNIPLEDDTAALLQLGKPHTPVLAQTAAQVYKEISEAAEASARADHAPVLAQTAAQVHKSRSEESPARTAQAAEGAQGGAAEKFGVDSVTEVLGDVSDTVSAVADQVGAEEYIGKMQGLVRVFSDQARSRAARAQADLEGQVGEGDEAFIISAAATIVETGEVAENMAEQFLEQVQAGRDEVADVLATLGSRHLSDEAAISESLRPSVEFLVELLGGTTRLLGSSLAVLRASQDQLLTAATPAALLVSEVPGDLAAIARQSLDDADTTLVAMSAFAERLRASVQETSDLGDRFIDASGDAASASLHRDLVDAARRVSALLSGDFVAEESARRLGGRSAAPRSSCPSSLLAGLVLAALAA